MNSGVGVAKQVSGSSNVTARDRASGLHGWATVTVEAPALQSITIKPDKAKIVGGGSQDFTATGKFSDGNYKPLTTGVTWTSSDEKVLSVDNTGHATVKGPGTATLTAKALGVPGSTKVTVVPPGKGAKKVNIQILVYTYKGDPMVGYQGYAEFQREGAENVTAGGAINGGVFNLANVSLMPEGSMTFSAVSTGAGKLSPSGLTKYKVPDSGRMTFSVRQKADSGKVIATTREEAAEKLGLKGTVELSGEAEFKVMKAGAKVTGEAGKDWEESKGNEETFEWEVTWGTDVFEFAK